MCAVVHSLKPTALLEKNTTLPQVLCLQQFDQTRGYFKCTVLVLVLVTLIQRVAAVRKKTLHYKYESSPLHGLTVMRAGILLKMRPVFTNILMEFTTKSVNQTRSGHGDIYLLLNNRFILNTGL